jgi:hypothetical protein
MAPLVVWIAASPAFYASVAHAEPTTIPGITVLTIVRWSGTDCILGRTADGQRDLCNTVTQPRSESIVEHGKAVGDLVGVDPAMGKAAWVSCEMFLNGSSYMGDAALAGDGSDATCLKVLQ